MFVFVTEIDIKSGKIKYDVVKFLENITGDFYKYAQKKSHN